MKIDDIFGLWEVDSKIDRAELGSEAIKIPQLHHKYFKIYTNERLVLRKYEAEMKTLRMTKYEFYTQGPTKETMELGWELPASGKILRADANAYIESDKDIINLSLKIGIQHEKVELLDSIIKSLSQRGYNLSAAINWEKFKQGI
jgi:hypothetical protein